MPPSEHQRTESKPDDVSAWVWRSRTGTTEAGFFSVLAAFETIIAVVAYWTYAILAQTQMHLLLGVIAAPLLLLRSPDSISTGVAWFEKFDNWVSPKVARADQGGRIRRTALPTLVAFCSIILAVMVRIAATVSHPITGIMSLSANWWRTLFATDLFTKPELVPGYDKPNSHFTYDSILRGLRQPAFEYNKHSLIIQAILFAIDLLSSVAGFLVTLGPSYAYRMSIKSTAWAHWPLAYITKPTNYANDPEEIRLRLWSDPREWFRRVIMVLTFAGVILVSIPNLLHARLLFPAGVISFVQYAALIDFRFFLQPWRATPLISAIITLGLTWYGLELSILLRRPDAHQTRQATTKRWATAIEYAMRVRNVCSWIFWALILVHTGLWLAPSVEWIGGYPRGLLHIIYGDFLPPSLG